MGAETGKTDHLEKTPSRDELLASLHDAEKRLQGAEHTKKADAKCHAEAIKAIKTEIKDILAQLEPK